MTQSQENKFIIKSEIYSIIKNIEKFSHRDLADMENIVAPIKKFNDKKIVFKILLNEFIKCNDDYKLEVLFFILSYSLEKAFLIDSLWLEIKTENYSDEIRNKLITLLRQLGEYIDYEEYSKYFENPDEIVDNDTKKLINTAVYNPEAQIDFLDFISTLNDSDWELMLQSLCEDFTGDSLANMFIPLLYMNLDNETRLEYVLNCLAKSNSFLSYKHFLYFSNDEKFNSNISKLAKKYANELKLKGCKLDYDEKFYRSALSNSKISDSYISIIDGCSNQCLLLSRILENGHYQFFAAVVQNSERIVDCFGFYEINKIEYERIYSRFFIEQKIVKVDPVVIRNILETSEKYSLDNNLYLPYEYFSWKFLLYDIPCETKNYIDKIEDTLSQIEVPNNDNLSFLNSFYIQSWFYDEKNRAFKIFIDEIRNIKDNNAISLTLENLFLVALSKLFDDIEVNNLKKRLKILAYILYLDKNKFYNEILCVLNNEKHFKSLLSLIAKKTVYEYCLREKEKFNKKVITSPFMKKNKQILPIFTKDEIIQYINQIEKDW